MCYFLPSPLCSTRESILFCKSINLFLFFSHPLVFVPFGMLFVGCPRCWLKGDRMPTFTPVAHPYTRLVGEQAFFFTFWLIFFRIPNLLHHHHLHSPTSFSPNSSPFFLFMQWLLVYYDSCLYTYNCYYCIVVVVLLLEQTISRVRSPVWSSIYSCTHTNQGLPNPLRGQNGCIILPYFTRLHHHLSVHGKQFKKIRNRPSSS